MTKIHRLSRRLFLSELGRSTLAVAVLGTGIVACSSDTDTDSATGAAADPDGSQTGAADDAAGSDTTAAPDSGPASEDEAGGRLQWERVDFGFVSAYVLVRGSEVAIVDTGTAGNADRIDEALGTLSLAWDQVDHVLVTHAHGDHVGGLDQVLTLATDATGYAGIGDVESLSAPRELVVVTGGDEVFGLQILATPGHTPGHISVFDPDSGLLVAGDAMVSDGGRLQGPVPEFTADLDLAHASLDALPADAVQTIVVGHGDPVTDNAGGQLRDLAAAT